MSKPKKEHILCLEADSDTSIMLTILLESAGYNVTAFSSAEDALSFAKSEKIDLYILDRIFPDKAGIELCRQIRQFDSRTPILFYSCAAYSSIQEEIIEAGGNAYLAKPDFLDELGATISRLLNKHVKKHGEGFLKKVS